MNRHNLARFFGAIFLAALLVALAWELVIEPSLGTQWGLPDENEDLTDHVLNLLAVVLISIGTLTPPALLLRRYFAERDQARRNLELARFSMDSASDAVFWIRPDGRFFYVNQAACKNLGFSRRKLLTLSVPDIAPEFAADAWRARWAKIKAAGSLATESVHRRRDGTTFPVEISVKYLEFDGEEYGLAIVRDITRRMQAEQALRASETQLRLVIDALPVLIAFIDADRRYRLVNETCASWYRMRPGDIIGKRVSDIHSDTEYAKLRPMVDRVLAGETVTFEKTVTYPDGRTRDVLYMCIPYVDEGETVQGYFTLSKDISKRKLADRRAEIAQAQLFDALETISEGFILFDANDQLVLCNRRYREMYSGFSDLLFPGVTFEELVRAGAERGLVPIGNGGIEEYVRKRVAQHRNPQGPFELYQTTGSWVWVEERRTKDGGIVGTRIDITERKLAEQALLRSEASLANAQRIAGLGNWERDLATGELHWSDGIYRIFGLKPREFAATFEAFMDRVHPDDRDFVRGAVERAISRSGSYSIDHRIVLPNGEVRIVLEEGEVAHDDSGRPARFTGTIQDITERKRTEQAVIASQKRFAGIVDTASDAIISVDAKRRITLFNAGAEQIFGYPAAEILGQPLERLLPARFHAAHDGYMAEFVRAAEPSRMMSERREVFGLRRDGTEFPAEASISKLDLEDGMAFTIMLRDITKRKQAEAALRLSEERFRGVVDNSPASIFLKDIEGRYLLVNKQFETWFGIKSADALSKTVHDFFPGHAIADIVSRQDREIVETGAVREWEVETPFHDGEMRTTLMLKFPITGRDGEVTAVGTVETDITGRKRTEVDLLKAKEEAELSNRSKTEFLANMSHELRTPLNSIIGFSDILKEQMFGPLGDEKYARYAGDINDSGRHLLGLINDILDVSRIETGDLVPNEDTVDVAAVLASCGRLVRQRADEAGLALDVETPDRLPGLRADERHVKQILLNLLANAIKFTPAGGRVTLGAVVDAANGFVFTVTDTGIGIRVEDMETVMALFGQADSSLARKYEGAGLGLPLSRKLAQLHGGDLSLASEPGQGTTVTVRFPPERVIGDDPADTHEREQSREDGAKMTN